MIFRHAMPSIQRRARLLNSEHLPGTEPGVGWVPLPMSRLLPSALHWGLDTRSRSKVPPVSLHLQKDAQSSLSPLKDTWGVRCRRCDKLPVLLVLGLHLQWPNCGHAHLVLFTSMVFSRGPVRRGRAGKCGSPCGVLLWDWVGLVLSFPRLGTPTPHPTLMLVGTTT